MPDITDALDRLQNHNPAENLSPLSTNERDQIRERIITASPPVPSRPARQRRLRTTLLRGRVIAAFAVVLVGGGAATAAVLDQSTTTLVANGLTCVSGTTYTDASVSASDVVQSGDSPAAKCAPLIGAPAAQLVACAKPGVAAVVFEANSDPAEQCSSLGLSPLPTDYNSAVTQVDALRQALTADYDAADCVPPKQLVHEADADLRRFGFTDWHAVIETQRMGYPGSCGQYPTEGSPISTADAALDAGSRTVMIEIGAPRSTLQLAERVLETMINASGNQCYTLGGAQLLVRNMLDKAAGHTVPVKFALTKELPNTTMYGGLGGDGRQQQYNQGCTVVIRLGTASDGQTFQVVLQNNTGPLDPNNRPLPASAYQPDLTNG
jgi:hypothetical protein